MEPFATGLWAVQSAPRTPDTDAVIAAADAVESHMGVKRLPPVDGYSTFECENCTCVVRGSD